MFPVLTENILVSMGVIVRELNNIKCDTNDPELIDAVTGATKMYIKILQEAGRYDLIFE